MNHRNHKTSTKTLSLTEEEALALLEICFHSKVDDEPMKERVIHMVGDLCRDFIRSETQDPARVCADRSLVRETLNALVKAKYAADAACA